MMSFTTLSASAVPIRQANIDTDQLLPKKFLTGISREGYGRHLFHDWRYLDLDEQEPNPDFILNEPRYHGAEILLAGQNFGCGSSREHAPWAIADYGFKAVIAPSFADIFYSNCINNQILPVCLDDAAMGYLFVQAEKEPTSTITVNLPEQTVHAGNKTFSFDIEAHHKYNLVNGLDLIGQSLALADKIAKHEQELPDWLA